MSDVVWVYEMRGFNRRYTTAVSVYTKLPTVDELNADLFKDLTNYKVVEVESKESNPGGRVVRVRSKNGTHRYDFLRPVKVFRNE